MEPHLEEFLRTLKAIQPIEYVTKEEYELIDTFCECHTAEELIAAHNNFVAYLNVALRIAMRVSAEQARIPKPDVSPSDFHKTALKESDGHSPVQNTLF